MAQDIKKDVIVDFKVKGEKKAQDGIKGITKETEKAEKSQKDLGQTTGQVSGKLDQMTGGAISGMKGLVAGVKSGVMAFKSLRLAIISTGLGALVVVVASVAAAFRGSEEGQNKFNKILSVTGAIVGNLVDLLADFGEFIIGVFENPQQAIKDFADLIKDNITNRFEGLMELIPQLGKAIDLLFSGEFSEAGKVATNAVSKVALGVDDLTGKIGNATDKLGEFIDENIREGREAARVADMRAKADKIERDLLIERATLENEIAQERLKARQEDQFSASQRRKALLRAQELEEQLLAQEKEALQLRADAQTLENNFSRSNKENLDEEARLKAAVIQQEAKRTNAARTTQRELNRVNNEIIRDEEAKAKILQSFRDSEQDDKLKKLDQDEENAIKELERLKATEEEKADVREFFRLQRLAREEEIRQTEEEKRLERQEKEKERLAKEFEEELKIEEENLEARFQLIEQQRQRILDNEKINEQQRTSLLQANSNKRKQIEDAEIQARKNRNQELEQITTEGLGAIAESVGLGKEFAIAKTLFDTFQSSRAAFSSQLIPGDPTSLPRAIGAAALSAASGLADVASIKSIETPSVAGATGGGGRGGSTPAPPTPPSFNLVGQANTSSITQSENIGQNQPVNAVVVSREVSSQQQADRNAQEQSTF